MLNAHDNIGEGTAGKAHEESLSRAGSFEPDGSMLRSCSISRLQPELDAAMPPAGNRDRLVSLRSADSAESHRSIDFASLKAASAPDSQLTITHQEASATFGSALLGQERQVDLYGQEGVDNLSKLVDFTKKRAALEEDYAKSLMKLIKSMQQNTAEKQRTAPVSM
jgi:hypothetical protein